MVVLNQVESVDFAKEIAMLWSINPIDETENQLYDIEDEDIYNLEDDPIKRIAKMNY